MTTHQSTTYRRPMTLRLDQRPNMHPNAPTPTPIITTTETHDQCTN